MPKDFSKYGWISPKVVKNPIKAPEIVERRKTSADRFGSNEPTVHKYFGREI